MIRNIAFAAKENVSEFFSVFAASKPQCGNAIGRPIDLWPVVAVFKFGVQDAVSGRRGVFDQPAGFLNVFPIFSRFSHCDFLMTSE